MVNWSLPDRLQKENQKPVGLGHPSPTAAWFATIVSALILTFIPSPLFATITFERTFVVPETQGWFPHNFIQTIDKGYLYITCSHDDSSYMHLVLVKVDSLANPDWVYIHPQKNSCLAHCNYRSGLALSADSQYFAGGCVFDGIHAGYWAFLVKVKANGRSTLWEYLHEPGEIRADAFEDVAALPDGGCFAAGTFFTDSGGKSGLFRFDRNGSLGWYRYYCPKPNNWDIVASKSQVLSAPDGGAILGARWCQMESETLPEYCGMYVLRVDSLGNPIWIAQDTWPGQFIGYFWEMEWTTDGNIAFFGICCEGLDSLAGFVKVYSYYNGEVLLNRLVMTKRRPGPSEPIETFFVRDGAVTPDGGFVLVGELTPDLRDKPYRIFLLRLNSEGDSLWFRSYGPKNVGWEFGFAVVPTPDTGFCILGSQDKGRALTYAPYIIKTDSLGLVHWTMMTEKDVKPPTEILLNIVPNPFNNTTTIHYQLPLPTLVRITAFDISGRTVATLLDQNQPAGTHQLLWQPEGFAQGVYFIQLETPSLQMTKRILLLR